MKLAWRIYSALCGLFLGPALMGLVLAWLMGVLTGERLKDVYAVLSEGKPLAGEVEPAPVVKDPNAAAQAAPGTPPPADLRVWERRLNALDAGIVSNVKDLGREIARLEEEDKRLRDVRDHLARLLTTVLGGQVTPEDVTKDATSLVEKMNAKNTDTERLPKLVATLATIEPRALASILAGDKGSPGLDEEQSARLLAGFPPRKAGEVLSEMGKLAPAYAQRMVERLGAKPGSGGGNP